MIEVSGKTDRGLVREINQDAYSILKLDDRTYLIVVCDGMGGEKGGEVASKIAIENIQTSINKAYRSAMEAGSIYEMLSAAISLANLKIHDRASKEIDLRGMGTTAIIGILRPDVLYFLNVGDSRVYGYFDDEVKQISTDHTVVQVLYEEGKIKEEEVQSHPNKHLITRALGVESTVKPDEYTISLKKGDKILFCTDGISNYFTNEGIYNILKSGDIKENVENLCAQAIAQGGKDNLTAVVAETREPTEND